LFQNDVTKYDDHLKEEIKEKQNLKAIEVSFTSTNSFCIKDIKKNHCTTKQSTNNGNSNGSGSK
jgi:hypothetical protein